MSQVTVQHILDIAHQAVVYFSVTLCIWVAIRIYIVTRDQPQHEPADQHDLVDEFVRLNAPDIDSASDSDGGSDHLVVTPDSTDSEDSIFSHLSLGRTDVDTFE